MRQYIDELRQIIGSDRVVEMADMSEHTTFHIGGPADFLVDIDSEAKLIAVIKYLKKYDIPYIITGNGSNLLVSDEGIEGGVLKLNTSFSAISLPYKLENFTNHQFAITALAGTLLSSLAAQALRQGLGDMVELAGIPGSVGGAIYMNAGAYDKETSEVLGEIKVYDANKDEVYSIASEDLDFSYRHSRLMEEESLIVLSTTWLLEKKSEADIKYLKDKYISLAKKRADKQPVDMPSAGSFFKRPKGNYAGALIEASGLKGLSYGDAAVSNKHAGFIVNTGKASCKDVLELAKTLRDRVKADSGVVLEMEPKLVGRGVK